VRHISPDLILLDLTMPIMDGWSFVGQYRRDGTTGARIVLLTGNPQAPEIARSLGADGYLTKPFDVDQLMGVVTRELSPTRATG
jgi:two-component system chemotaxis response regulator CheY